MRTNHYLQHWETSVCLCVDACMYTHDFVLGSGCESKDGFGVFECICM